MFMRRIATAIILLLTAIFCQAQPAEAGWTAIYPCAGQDYGADYYAAVQAMITCANEDPSKFWVGGFAYKSDGEPWEFSMCHPYYGRWSCWAAQNLCNNQLMVIQGCASSVDYPGCNCGNNQPNSSGQGSVGQPINVASGNMFETAADFTTVGQNPLTARRYYNSYQAYAVGSFPPWSTIYNFYNSRFGFGWRSEYDSFVVPQSIGQPNATVDAIMADGEPVHFAWDSTHGVWYVAYWTYGNGWSQFSDPRHDLNISLSIDVNNNFNIRDANDTIWQYDSTGKLTSITYRNGYLQILTYSSTACGSDINGVAITCNTGVFDSLGRQIAFTYQQGTGLVSQMTTTVGTATTMTQYAYLDPIGAVQPPQGDPGMWVLQQVTYPDNTFIKYSYNDSVNHTGLTSITDEDNNTYSSWTYDATTQRALSSQLAGGANSTTVQYNDSANPPTRTVTNALGKQFVYSLNSFQGHSQIASIEGLATAHTPDSTIAYQYDPKGFLQLLTTGQGRQTYFVNDQLGRVTSETDGYNDKNVARTIGTTWDQAYDVPDTIVEPNLTISMNWPGGLLTQLTETDTTTQNIPYITAGETRSWNFSYYPGSGTCSPAAGLLWTVQGPLGASETTTYCYNGNGFVSSVTNPLSQVTQITSWNGWGEPLTSIDPNNITTQYTYDSRARLKTIIINPGSNQSETQFGYDPAGNLTSIVFPDNSSLTYGYDAAHRLKWIDNNVGEQIAYTLDTMDDRTNVSAGMGVGGTFDSITKNQNATFDELARVLTEIGAYSQVTHHAYDKDNYEVSTIDPRSKLYQHAFDAIGRVMKETDPDFYATNIGYNGKDEVTSVTDARSLQTSYVRDGFGDIIQITSPDTGTTVLWYDANGKVTQKTDARNVTTNYTNDVLGRSLTRSVVGDSSQNVTYTWDILNNNTYGIGRLGTVTDASGSTAMWYDQFGNATRDSRTINSHNYATRYSYDPAGHVSAITYPSGLFVQYTRDAFGRISGTTAQPSGQAVVTIFSNAKYKPFGPLRALAFGNGLNLTQKWDLDYHLTSIYTSSAGETIQNLAYSDDPDGNIQAITDSQNNGEHSQSFGYDDLNRVASASGLYPAQSYQYDGVGNRSKATINGVQYIYNPSPTSNQIVSVTQTGGGRYFYYLPSGQVYSDQRNPSSDYQFGYDGYGRLASASLNNTSLATYAWNGFDQRAVKAAATTTDFVYDRAGHMIAEMSDTTGTALREYVWMDDTPVAMVDYSGGSPVVYDIHADHLGRPQKLTDQSGGLQWDGVFDPFGNPYNINGSLTMLLGFPGQYWDSETQLAQNWHRDYDPSIGRYVESDPIGLDSGLNTYNYAASMPSRYIDPTGDAPRSPTFWCTWCGAPHGGLRGDYCPDCYDKSKQPNSEIPPLPDPDENKTPVPQTQNKCNAPPPWLPFALVPLFILLAPVGG